MPSDLQHEHDRDEANGPRREQNRLPAFRSRHGGAQAAAKKRSTARGRWRPEPVVQRPGDGDRGRASGCSRRRARCGAQFGSGRKRRADGADDCEGARLEHVRAQRGYPLGPGKPGHRSRSVTRSTAAFEASPSRPGGGVEQRSDRARAVDRPEADWGSECGRPGERPERLDRCCDEERQCGQAPVRRDSGGKRLVPAGQPDCDEDADRRHDTGDGEESSAPHLQLIGLRRAAPPPSIDGGSPGHVPVPEPGSEQCQSQCQAWLSPGGGGQGRFGPGGGGGELRRIGRLEHDLDAASFRPEARVGADAD